MITFQCYERELSRTFSTRTHNKQALPHTHHKLIDACVADPKAGQNPEAPPESSKADSLRSGWFSC